MVVIQGGNCFLICRDVYLHTPYKYIFNINRGTTEASEYGVKGGGGGGGGVDRSYKWIRGHAP